MSKLTMNNAPKATGKLLDDSEFDELTSIGQAIATAIQNPEKKAEPADPEEQAESASNKLADFRLTPLARSLLDKALVNVTENTGRGIEDPLAKDQVETLAGIVKASGDDLARAIEFVVDTMQDEADTYVYKLCYATQKALNFIGNMAYRRALDPKSDFDLEMYIDQREEHMDAPVGLGSEQELAFDKDGNRKFNVAGGEEVKADHEQILDALDTLHVYLQIMTEAFGWDPERPMPYMAILDEMTGKFEHVYDCEACLDLMEIRYKESRVKKQEKQLAGLKKIREAALAALKKASSK